MKRRNGETSQMGMYQGGVSVLIRNDLKQHIQKHSKSRPRNRVTYACVAEIGYSYHGPWYIRPAQRI